MNPINLQYLKDQLKYLGFGVTMYPELEELMQEQTPEFQILYHAEFNQDYVSACLFFRRADSLDKYYFNRYEAVLQKARGGWEELRQIFYINQGQGVTLKEAYNLLDGRCVYKELVNREGQRYHAWIQLDFRERVESGNYKIKP